MPNFTITPEVNKIKEFIEIANDFSNPLDLVREAISNSFDACPSRIDISFSTISERGEDILLIELSDNGEGMDRVGIQSFFDLGNSLRSGDETSIGEKGHGTKVYFNSKLIEVITTHNNITLHATMIDPFGKLHDNLLPEVIVEETNTGFSNGTKIIIKGYNNNRCDKFFHEILKDYVLWFTKFGSIETKFSETVKSHVKLYLKGLDRTEPELIQFGHLFPEESKSVEKLFGDYLTQAPDYYCKWFLRSGFLKNYPYIKYDAIFCVEGTKVKYSYNPMIKRPGHSPKGGYTIQDRYGVWLCKDFIPVQRKNEWITYKGSEYTRFHAFFNCQKLRLTANRGSVDNTPTEIMQDIRDEVTQIYNEIIDSDDWRNLDWLVDESIAFTTKEKERKDFKWRTEKAYKANVAQLNGYTLVEPQQESGVFALLIQLNSILPDLFPFKIIDYDTHSGFDIIVKGNDNAPIYQSKLFYVELKYMLKNQFNHSFENLHSIICWDTEIKHGDIAEDISKESRKFIIAPSEKTDDYTKYFLDSDRSSHKIEVYVLKDFLKELLKVEFRPRPKK
jgi:hypothetical protein